jgi:OFA family oxalate/formate antiporter-like MFS transporter
VLTSSHIFLTVGSRRLQCRRRRHLIRTSSCSFPKGQRPEHGYAPCLARAIAGGFTRPFFGWVSDHIGRENTMFIAFLFEGIGIYALLHFASDPFLFVLLSGLVFFAWGEIYSLFPATCTDIYGRKFATTNYGMLYTAKGTAALLVPLGNVLTTWTGSWTAVFVIAAFLNIIAAVMALAVLRPMRRKAMT